MTLKLPAIWVRTKQWKSSSVISFGEKLICILKIASAAVSLANLGKHTAQALWLTFPPRVALCTMAEYFHGLHSRSPQVEQTYSVLGFSVPLH
jgi:hypothetical protein